MTSNMSDRIFRFPLPSLRIYLNNGISYPPLHVRGGGPVPLAVSIDPDGRYVDFSDAYLRRLGYTGEELIGLRPQDHMSPESTQRMSEEYLPLFMQSGSLTNVPMERNTKGGEVVEFLMSAVAERDTEGNLVRSIAVFTEQKRASAHRTTLSRDLQTSAYDVSHDRSRRANRGGE